MNDNPPDIIDFKIVKARKSHVCIECISEIEKGEKYEKVKGLWQGEWNTYKTCLDCVKIRDKYVDENDKYFGELWETLRGGSDDFYNELIERHGGPHNRKGKTNNE